MLWHKKKCKISFLRVGLGNMEVAQVAMIFFVV